LMAVWTCFCRSRLFSSTEPDIFFIFIFRFSYILNGYFQSVSTVFY
jgi:hypothetical protein